MKLDDIDKKIINVLLKQSKYSFNDIGKIVGVSSVTVLNRIRKLEKEKIIKDYTVNIDLAKIGFDLQAIIDIKTTKDRLLEIEKRLSKNSRVTNIYDTTGDYDVTIIARFMGKSELDQFIRELRSFDFVEKIKTKIVLNTIKEDPVRL